MADISYSINASCTTGGQTAAVNYTGTVTLATGAAPLATQQTIGTSPEAITLGDTPLPAIVILQNTDATNYVELDMVTPLVNKIKLPPGGVPVFMHVVAGRTIYAQANTAPCNVNVNVYPV